jgi:glycine/D-amino acid oxidase-like deaminating enzyme
VQFRRDPGAYEDADSQRTNEIVKFRVAVLGAGIQGTCVALELAARGHEVDLYDRNAACITQASANNEGKIHLGFVYANDPSRRTARLMAEGALCFAPLLRGWLGATFDRVPVSSPFCYAVNAGSLLTVDEIRGHLDDCVSIAADIASPASEYFGQDFRRPVRRLDPAEWSATFSARDVRAVFQTHEIAVDPEALGAVIRERIAAVPGINLRLGTFVQAVAPERNRLTVAFECAGTAGRESYDHVVNALWDGRLAIDASHGQVPERPWIWRLRRNIRVEASRLDWAILSTTNVLGPFGDIVNFGNGVFYLSWYPSGRVGISRDLVPSNWQPAGASTDPSATEAGIVEGLGRIMPAIRELARDPGTRLRLTSGIVFAWGATDISDRHSTLHQRYQVGVHSDGRYHSIDTGKYCLAPLFAREVAARITSSAGAN